MNFLTGLGTVAVYFWVIVTLLLGGLLEVGLVLLVFGEWKDRKKAEELPFDDGGDDQPFG